MNFSCLGIIFKKVWDLSQRKSIFHWDEHNDFVSSLLYHSEKKILLSAGYFLSHLSLIV